MTTPTLQQSIATLFFGLALLHSLNVNYFERQIQKHSRSPHLTHWLRHFSEIEVVFGLWGMLYFLSRFFTGSVTDALAWFDQLHFEEPIFVVIVMVIASTAPILNLAQKMIDRLLQSLQFLRPRVSSGVLTYASILILGPCLGSLITEPAAMTVSALLLGSRVFYSKPSSRFLYTSIATLFVNVSIGGVLTHFAAPPVLMVAKTWGLTTPFMFQNFGWKAIIAIILNTGIAILLNQKELNSQTGAPASYSTRSSPLITFINLFFMLLSVLLLHHSALLIGVFLVFLDFFFLTRASQGSPKTKPAILVGFFLAGLLILTAEQGWWLSPLLASLEKFTLFLGASLFTAITDNAAITSLASRSPNLSEIARYSILAGAVTGGGLTLLANAPNPAGYSLLKKHFHDEGLSPLRLFLYAVLPTLFTGAIFWIL